MDAAHNAVYCSIALMLSENGVSDSSATWWVYIVECKDRSLYTGITNDLARRVLEHNRANGARYTRQKRPVKLVYCEEVENRSLALRREALIKTWPRSKKLLLIREEQNHSPSQKALGVKQREES